MINQQSVLSTFSYGALAAAALALAPQAMAQTGPNTTSLTHSVVLSDLQDPWDMAFLPDGTMFFTEKCQGLSVMLPSGEVNALLGMSGSDGYATTADDLFCEGQAGMNGVAVDPGFADNRTIYVYSTSNLSEPQTNRVMRMTVSEDLTNVADRTDIVDDIPYKVASSDHPFGGPGAHNGGRLRFNAGDGFLYVTTGDNHNSAVPQSPTLMGSKILRIDGDGNAAPDNAPPEGFDPRTYTYGHRNVQGIAFHPETSTPIVAEHGPWHSDEITVLANGGNGGWDPRPNMAGRGDCPDEYCGYMPNQLEGMNPFERAAFMPMTDFVTYPDAMPPIWNNNGLSQGTSSAEFLTGDQWGDWNGHMVVGVMGIGFGGTPIGQRIDVIELSEEGTAVVDVTEMTLPMEPGRFRSLVLGPDGSLYAAVDEGMIHKLTP
ncbi:PQQ-dependent sugar dehydrogenase [Litoreibacter roseus]|uniref:Glucose dehydrogenase n=1 Tax=Litoreibacter roseus TaxID=2601869 RepID=A0A6N6JB34_9RHOB|nr:PQQ-dependent sugar dehydrogenase [Litoreibacter roseus]GFE63385.1 glucose dehydrogenase [Litoreibacter roseus]